MRPFCLSGCVSLEHFEELIYRVLRDRHEGRHCCSKNHDVYIGYYKDDLCDIASKNATEFDPLSETVPPGMVTRRWEVCHGRRGI